jgi:catechol 2,3-dioxygenase-like lactoylglutathione lyase family enzyme
MIPAGGCRSQEERKMNPYATLSMAKMMSKLVSKLRRKVLGALREGATISVLIIALVAFPSNNHARAMDLDGLDHFAINVADLQRAADWYQKVFGFTVLHKWDTTWMIGRDNMKIGLFLRPNATPLPNIDSQLIIQHVAFLVDGDKFDAAKNALLQAGVTIDGPEDTGIAYSMFFTDPDGHLLEITTYHPVPPANVNVTSQISRGP